MYVCTEKRALHFYLFITLLLILFIAVLLCKLTHTLKCATTVGRNVRHSATVDDGRDDNGPNEDDDVSVYTLFMRRAQRTE